MASQRSERPIRASPPSHSSLPKVALETVCVADQRSFSTLEDGKCRPLPFSAPLSFRRSKLSAVGTTSRAGDVHQYPRAQPDGNRLSCGMGDSLSCRYLRPSCRDCSRTLGVCLLVGCLTSQQHASVSQGRICSDNLTCCHTEIQVADQTFHLTQSPVY